MKKNRLFILLIAVSLSLTMMAQNQLNEACLKAQKSLMEYLRSIGMSPSIDTRDNSVCFKKNDMFYWITFEGDGPVLYTVHRKGIKFDSDSSFKPIVATVACNEVNNKHKIKCIYDDKRIEFIMQTYAKEPSDFHGGFGKMIAAFNKVEDTFKNSYDKAYKKWRDDSIAAHGPNVSGTPGISTLKIKSIAFGNFDKNGNPIANYNQPLHRSNCRYIKSMVSITSREKGVFRIGMKIINPDGKPMVAHKGTEYATTKNIEITKTNKPVQVELPPFGSENDKFWKAGEYKVEFYDYESNVLLDTISFNLL